MNYQCNGNAHIRSSVALVVMTSIAVVGNKKELLLLRISLFIVVGTSSVALLIVMLSVLVLRASFLSPNLDIYFFIKYQVSLWITIAITTIFVSGVALLSPKFYFVLYFVVKYQVSIVWIIIAITTIFVSGVSLLSPCFPCIHVHNNIQ